VIAKFQKENKDMKEMMNLMGSKDKKATIEDPDGLVNVK